MTTVLHIMKCFTFQLPVFVQIWWLNFVLSNKENVIKKFLHLMFVELDRLRKQKLCFFPLNKQRVDIIILQESDLFKTLVEEIFPK